ncbi:hypothetical protein V6N00_07480 [Tersicoccus sp. MR15.9]|uniref:hypothetical protein n=1 Tax=Tersicoccus mangrovi TaxID=3121635 RepID=UPI002FE65505
MTGPEAFVSAGGGFGAEAGATLGFDVAVGFAGEDEDDAVGVLLLCAPVLVLGPAADPVAAGAAHPERTPPASPRVSTAAAADRDTDPRRLRGSLMTV